MHNLIAASCLTVIVTALTLQGCEAKLNTSAVVGSSRQAAVGSNTSISGDNLISINLQPSPDGYTWIAEAETGLNGLRIHGNADISSGVLKIDIKKEAIGTCGMKLEISGNQTINGSLTLSLSAEQLSASGTAMTATVVDGVMQRSVVDLSNPVITLTTLIEQGYSPKF